tara:strand:+ start:34 stop:558 length:525 start_codon:yes stop_codon:yes gene_type:complete
MIKPLSEGRVANIHESVFVAESADIVGAVEIGEGSSVWYQTVLRGDVMPITIGKQTNIQDHSCIHGTFRKCATVVGDRVSIGHRVILHGCEIEHSSLVGMGAIIMDNSKIGHHSLVGAGALVTEGKEFPPYSLIIGSPAKVARPLREDEIEFLDKYADKYVHYASWYTTGNEES